MLELLALDIKIVDSTSAAGSLLSFDDDKGGKIYIGRLRQFLNFP